MRFYVRVPVKITLFGEHAVVYGYPAIAATIPRYIEYYVRKMNKPFLRIVSRGIEVELKSVEIEESLNSIHSYTVDETKVMKLFSYIIEGLRLCRENVGLRSVNGIEIEIRSDLPIGVGLGTSAAISVATAVSCFVLAELNLDIKTIAKMAWNIEKRVQGAASPMDTHTIAYGGLRYIVPSIPEAERIDINYDLPIVVGYVPKKATTAELVAYVRKLKDRFPDIIDNVMAMIGRVVKDARKALEKGDLETLGLLMKVNHALLKTLNVVSEDVDRILYGVERVGALGGKMSGAGGGGAFIVLVKDRKDVDRITSVIQALGGTVVSTQIIDKGFELYVERC